MYDDKADFNKGIAVLRENKDFYIISTGGMTHTAIGIANNIKRQKISVGVIDIYTPPINEKLLIESIKGSKKLITMEEHFLPGGFGSAVCEVLIDNNILIPIKRIGLPLEKGYY